MKSAVAVTLVIVGALLIALPALSDYLHQRNVVEIARSAGARDVMLSGQMSELYRFGCWATGSLMIALPALASLRARKSGAAAD